MADNLQAQSSNNSPHHQRNCQLKATVSLLHLAEHPLYCVAIAHLHIDPLGK
ncbi:MAG: hypothetical protein AAFX01_05625 [Cyanobacteria bacterium J06638_28]